MKNRIRLLALLLCAAGWLNCGGANNPQLLWDNNFSSNVVRPGKKWPNEKLLTEGEKKLLEEKGEPSFVRIWFTNDGQVKRWMDVAEHFRTKSWWTMKKSWVYLDLNAEFEFTSKTNYIERPLSDQIKVLCTYGDPQDIMLFEQGADAPVEEWIYYSQGKRFKFLSGVQLSLTHQQALPEYKRY